MRHPASPAPPVSGCTADLSAVGPAALRLRYVVEGDIAALRVPAIGIAERRDYLWQTTCFELFVALDGASYAEFNFSPSTCWAAYRFDGYRDAMRAVAGVEPRVGTVVTDQRLTVSVDLDLSSLVPDLDRLAGLSAVIEAADGAKSWWALVHPAEKPDFHHRDCFALQLRAARES